MHPLSIFGIAVALAMDAFAVSLTTGVRLQRITPAITLRMAGVFGGFQFLMPVLGWTLGAGAGSISRPMITGWRSRCWPLSAER